MDISLLCRNVLLPNSELIINKEKKRRSWKGWYAHDKRERGGKKSSFIAKVEINVQESMRGLSTNISEKEISKQ